MRRVPKLLLLPPVAVLALTACTNAPPTGGATPTAPTAAATSAAPPTVAVSTLTSASLKSASQPFHVQADITAAGQTQTLTGDVNPATGEASLRSAGATALEVITVGSDVYLKSSAFAPLGVAGWLHLDLTKLRADSSLRQNLNPAATLGMLAGATGIRQTSPGTYEGVVDLSLAAKAVTDAKAKSVLEDLVREAGPGANEVPFTATIDAEGRLTGLTTTMTIAGGEMKTRLTLSEFGKSVAVARPPAAEITEAPAEVYGLI